MFTQCSLHLNVPPFDKTKIFHEQIYIPLGGIAWYMFIIYNIYLLYRTYMYHTNITAAEVPKLK